MAEFPADLRYTSEHEWVRETESTIVRVGITDFAASELGDIVYVSLPTVGAEVVAGDACGELESTKSVSDLYSPVTGIVATVNEQAASAPETINASPYDEGWLFEVELAEDADLSALLDAEAYGSVVGN